MDYIKNKTMTIDDFIAKLQTRTTFNVNRNDTLSEVTINFPSPFRWGDGDEKISSLKIDYDPTSKNVKKIEITGENLFQIVGYTYIHENYLWFTIKDMGQFNGDHIEDYPARLTINVQS